MVKIEVFERNSDVVLSSAELFGKPNETEIRNKVETLLSQLAEQSGTSYSLTEKNTEVFISID